MSQEAILCREIGSDDRDAVAALLTEGFVAQRRRAFWDRALHRLSTRPVPSGLPRFGYLLEAGGTIVGVLLLIFAEAPGRSGARVLRCNVSSWYLRPEYRAFGTMLVSRALRHRQATYTNVTPAPATEAILRAQGYVKYCEGRFLSLPILSRAAGRVPAGTRILRVRPGTPDDWFADGLLPGEAELLRSHAAWGCLCLVCEAPDGGRQPFVFGLRTKAGVVRLALLLYCRDAVEWVRCAAPLGRALARQGCLLAVHDADRPVPGLVGRFLGANPKYFRGADRPHLGDVAYSERAVFGV